MTLDDWFSSFVLFSKFHTHPPMCWIKLRNFVRLPLNKEVLAQSLTHAIFCETKNIESFNAYWCIRSYLIDLSIGELTELASDYGIEV